jgi:hypothetical protein
MLLIILISFGIRRGRPFLYVVRELNRLDLESKRPQV